MGNLTLEAENTSTISAEVLTHPASSGGFSGCERLGASLARNLIGYGKDGTAAPVEVQAYIKQSTSTWMGH